MLSDVKFSPFVASIHASKASISLLLLTVFVNDIYILDHSEKMSISSSAAWRYFKRELDKKECKMPNMFHRINISYTGGITNMRSHLNGDRFR